MPAGSQFNSTPGSTTETQAAKPRADKKRKGGPIHNDVLKELRRPVKLYKSRAEKQLELIQAQRQTLKLEAGLRKLAGQLRDEETKLQREIRQAGQADPELVKLLQARLIPIQKRLVSLHAQLDTVHMPCAADVDDSEDNNASEDDDGKENGHENEEAEEADEDEDEDEDEGAAS